MKSEAILQNLKKTLKTKGWTYSRLAQSMKMSEASMKRLFSGQGQLTLNRLEDICDCIDADMASVIFSASQDTTKPKVSLEQEKELAKNVKRLIFFTALRKGYTVDRALKTYKISIPEKDLFLRQLESMGLLERHPNDRVKILVDRSVQWIEGGPVRALYEQDMKDTFLASDFSKKFELCRFITVQLSEESLITLNRRVEKFIRDLNELNQLDQNLDLDGKKTTTVLIASRPWTPTQALEYLR